MLNNYIGGGQVFLHKIRMFMQVFWHSVTVSFLVGSVIGVFVFLPSLLEQDLKAAFSFKKALLVDEFDRAVNPFRKSVLGKKREHITTVNASTKDGVYGRAMDPRKVMRIGYFKNTHQAVLKILTNMLKACVYIAISSFLLIFLLWWKFGKNIKSDKNIDSGGAVLKPAQVRSKLKSLGLASEFCIGKMPLVRDMETRHFLVTGSTGSGKTNLIHSLLLQVEQKKHPVIVIDQTGEMIAKYYNKDRGDIIFNPLDSRSHNWDFWNDCGTREELERFSKILMGFNRKQSNSHSDPFWENAAETVFNACVEYLRPRKESIKSLVNMVCHSDLEYLKTVLANSEAGRYLGEGSKQTAASIVSVLASNAKPLSYLNNSQDKLTFSMKEHFAGIKEGSNAWLFLATKPSSRNLNLPLIACLTELSLASLMEIGIDQRRRVWVVMDELASLGKLPALSPIMTEGRKYGACVIAGMQSLNQLYEGYGHYGGSTIFGQFGTSFFFRNTEPTIAKMVSSMCGQQTIIRQQKNTSFGANEFRDGVSYTEQHQKKALVEPEDLASLAVGECYVLLPEPAIRLAKIQTDAVILKEKNEGFVLIKEETVSNSETEATDQIGSNDEPIESSNQEADVPRADTAPVSKPLEENSQDPSGSTTQKEDPLISKEFGFS